MNRSRPALLMPALLTALLLPVTGCTGDAGPLPVLAFSDDGTFLTRQFGEGLVLDEASPIPDVPKPMRFVPVPSRSSSSFDGYARTVTHVYQGRGELEDVIAFYQNHLPANGWAPAGNPAGHGPIQAYAKGPESLQISVGTAGGVATITVVIRPG